MTRFLRAWFPKTTATRPATGGPRFKPHVERLDDRITPTLGFATQQTFEVGPRPWGVAVGDFNADGRADVVAANNSADSGTTVSVLVNSTPNGAAAPSFAAKQDFTVGTGPIHVAVGDLNGDGRPDIVTANVGPDTVSVLLNTTPAGASALSFAPKQDFTVGSNPISVTLGDFNSDGRLDIATTSNMAATVSVLLNTTPMQAGTATFAPKQDFTVGTGPRGIAVGDFNGDGRIDLATANATTSNVSVLLNTTATGAATPTFAAKQDFAVGTNPWSLVAADLDGDGRTDIAAANRDTNNVSVLRNTTAILGGTPTFAAKQDSAVGQDPIAIAVGELNGDGRPDLVTGNYLTGQNTVSVLRNTSTNVLPTTTGPALVAQFGTTGVWAYKRDTGAWVQLTGANANALAASVSGNVIASFGGNGVYYYRASNQTWTKVNGIQAVALAIDPLGNAYASFNGYGTYRYRLATGQFEQLAASVADQLVASPNGDVVGNFPGFGVYRYQRTAPVPFHQINGYNATSLDVDRNGYVVAAFTGFGVGHYIPYAQGWRTVAPVVTAPAVALDGYGNIHASFPNGGGVYKFDYTNTWKTIAPSATAQTLAVDWYGNVFASFAGFPGAWEFNPHYGWNWRPQGFATAVSLAK